MAPGYEDGIEVRASRSTLGVSWCPTIESRFRPYPSFRVTVYTHDFGRCDLTPFVDHVNWTVGMDALSPPFTVSLIDTRSIVEGPRLRDQVTADEATRAPWAKLDLSKLIAAGDWIRIEIDRGRGLTTSYLGIVQTCAPSMQVGQRSEAHAGTKITGISAASIFDREIIFDHRFRGVPAYFDINSDAISAAIAGGGVGDLMFAIVNQAFGDGRLVAYPPGLVQDELSSQPWAMLAFPVDGALHGHPIQMIAANERRTVRSVFAAYLGMPELTELFVEYEDDRMLVVYQQHPWDAGPWRDLSALRVENPLGVSASTSVGNMATFFSFQPQYDMGTAGVEWSLYAAHPSIPIWDIAMTRRYGTLRMQPSPLWWVPVGEDLAAWVVRWNERLWDWHALGRFYLTGGVRLDWTPEVRLATRLECPLNDGGDFHSFFVEGYTHSIDADPASGAVQGTTNVACVRGQPGEYVTPPAVPQYALRGFEESLTDSGTIGGIIKAGGLGGRGTA